LNKYFKYPTLEIGGVKLMEKNVYERYGLSSNPFRDLASETLDNIDIFHVTTEIDNKLTLVQEEIVNKENSAVIAILGDWGVGKTERLLMMVDLAKKKEFFHIYRNLTKETVWVVSEILEEILENTNLSFFRKYFSPPKWYRTISKTYKNIKKGYDPEKLGEAIAEAFNINAPSFILLNDLHNLELTKDLDVFFTLIHIIIDNIGPGVLLMISSEKKYFNKIIYARPSLNQRFNIKITLPKLKTNEASLLVAKRLLGKRLVDDLDPLYPFTEESIAVLNRYANGNPRYLLKLIDRIIDHASKRRVIQIDEDIIKTVLNITDIGKIPEQLMEGQSSIDSYIQPKKRQKINETKRVKRKRKVSPVRKSKSMKAPNVRNKRNFSVKSNNSKNYTNYRERVSDKYDFLHDLEKRSSNYGNEPLGLIDTSGDFTNIQHDSNSVVKVKQPRQKIS
jgi:hypothetical protein